jgi:hypothetical protein
MKGKITKRTVDATNPGEKDVFLWDTDLRGFGLKVSPAGSKVYIVQYRLGGREAPTQRYTIGKHGSPWTPDKAREEAERLLGRVANEVDPSKERKAKVAAHRADAVAPTLADFADRYIDEFAKAYKKPRTVEEDERNLRLHIKPTLGKLKLKDITPAHISKFTPPGGTRRQTPTAAARCSRTCSRWPRFGESAHRDPTRADTSKNLANANGSGFSRPTSSSGSRTHWKAPKIRNRRQRSPQSDYWCLPDAVCRRSCRFGGSGSISSAAA